MPLPILGLYFLGVLTLGLLAYDLNESKNSCESEFLDYVQAEAKGLKGTELQPVKARMEAACKVMEIKAKAVDSVVK